MVSLFYKFLIKISGCKTTATARICLTVVFQTLILLYQAVILSLHLLTLLLHLSEYSVFRG